jgi:hypothetical protein
MNTEPQGLPRILLCLAGAALLAASPGDVEQRQPTQAAEAHALMLYHDPSCGCCIEWAMHMREHGFEVVVEEADMQARRRQLGVPDHLASCHTAVSGGYLIEGHVPADDVRRLLAERPNARGLSVPGMPIGSPGMEQGDRRDAFNVLLFDDHGRFTVFNRYPAMRPEQRR